MFLQHQQVSGQFFLAIFSVTRPGDEIIAADPVYSPTRILTENYLKDFNIKTTFYNPHDLKNFEKNIPKKQVNFRRKSRK